MVTVQKKRKRRKIQKKKFKRKNVLKGDFEGDSCGQSRSSGVSDIAGDPDRTPSRYHRLSSFSLDLWSLGDIG